MEISILVRIFWHVRISNAITIMNTIRRTCLNLSELELYLKYTDITVSIK